MWCYLRQWRLVERLQQLKTSQQPQLRPQLLLALCYHHQSWQLQQVLVQQPPQQLPLEPGPELLGC